MIHAECQRILDVDVVKELMRSDEIHLYKFDKVIQDESFWMTLTHQI